MTRSHRQILSLGDEPTGQMLPVTFCLEREEGDTFQVDTDYNIEFKDVIYNVSNGVVIKTTDIDSDILALITVTIPSDQTTEVGTFSLKIMNVTQESNKYLCIHAKIRFYDC